MESAPDSSADSQEQIDFFGISHFHPTNSSAEVEVVVGGVGVAQHWMAGAGGRSGRPPRRRPMVAE